MRDNCFRETKPSSQTSNFQANRNIPSKLKFDFKARLPAHLITYTLPASNVGVWECCCCCWYCCCFDCHFCRPYVLSVWMRICCICFPSLCFAHPGRKFIFRFYYFRRLFISYFLGNIIQINKDRKPYAYTPASYIYAWIRLWAFCVHPN